MVKAEWGSKHICTHCGARYYDMKKHPPVCPSCGTVYDPDALTKSRRSRSSNTEEKAKKPVPETDLMEDLPIIDSDDSDDAVIEDADELGEDDMDVEDVVPIEDENESRS